MKTENPGKADGPASGRRKDERRKEDLPIEGEDRRDAERRSGTERRKQPRG